MALVGLEVWTAGLAICSGGSAIDLITVELKSAQLAHVGGIYRYPCPLLTMWAAMAWTY